MTGTELLELQGVLYGLPRARHRTKAAELLERVGLTAAADRRVGTYSGGMRRRLDLALSLIHEPTVLFLDEPTTGLDPMSRLALWDEIRRLNRDGTTVLLTTQYLEEADQLADRVAIIDHGRIVREGKPGRAQERGRLPTLFIDVDDDWVDEARRVLAAFGELRPTAEGRSASDSSTVPVRCRTSSAGSTRPGSPCTTSSSARRASTTCSPRPPGIASRAPSRMSTAIARARPAAVSR
jgi:ABC-2 type transport system ATP-binding protein